MTNVIFTEHLWTGTLCCEANTSVPVLMCVTAIKCIIEIGIEP